MTDTPIVRLGAELKRRRHEADLSQEELAEAAGSPGARAVISKAENGHKPLMSQEFAAAVDRRLDAGGVLVRLRNEAWLHQQATKVELDGTTVGEAGSDGQGESEGVDGTDRRDVLGLLAVSAGELAARIRQVRPNRQSLFRAQAAVQSYADRYAITPHGDLLAEVGRDWRDVQHALADGWSSDRYRREFGVVAGQLTYLLSRISFNLGDFAGTASFLDLVEAHAEATGDPGLGAAVSTMWSTLYFYMGDFPQALRTAEEGHRFRYPYHEAELYAYEARAHAALGDTPATMAALSSMEKTMVRATSAEVGGNPFTEESAMMFMGGIFARMGDSRRALPITGPTVERYSRMDDPPFEEFGNAWLAHAYALLPSDPAAAAEAGCRAVDVLDGRPTRTVLQRARDLAQALRPHQSMSSVGDLRERLYAAPRLGLGAGSMA